ncbi:MAG: trk/ktr system potassium uptake protein [Solirubrobacteraceae bacterium]|nr:trk/ktr system potassium uptake protein [Solirubrobacteraceae bacterium]
MATSPWLRRRLRLAIGGVDVGSSLDLVGGVLKWVGLTFIAPAVVAIGYGEPPWPFLVAAAVTVAAGLALDAVTRDQAAAAVGVREGFLVVALTWLVVPAFGALPFLLGGVPQLSNPFDAYFESVSGFTASGATVVPDVEALPRSMLFWRQLSHWLGGMGIIVLAVAVLPRLRIGGRHLFERELAGPTEIERMSATIRETARRLWRLYIGLTALAVVVLATLGWTGLDPEMSLFDAVAHAFSVLSLGGFSSKNDSAAGFAPVTQWALMAFMVLAGFNFLRLWVILVQRRGRVVARDEEARLYLAFLLIGAGLLIVELLAGGFASGEAGVRHAAFQGVAIMTTTGFATADFTEWGPLAAMTILLLMFVGASAGSTCGSIKVIRHLMLFKMVRREIEQTVHRDAVRPVVVSGVVVDDRALRSTIVFVLLYLLTFALGAMALTLDARRTGLDLTAFDAFAASAACLGNVGPAFGFAGPFGSYEPFGNASTGLLTILMWLGRVEILPAAVLLSRRYWRA